MNTVIFNDFSVLFSNNDQINAAETSFKDIIQTLYNSSVSNIKSIM